MAFAWASPPQCDKGHGWMVPDHGLDEDGFNDGTTIYVCDTCCWSVPRAPAHVEPPCKCSLCQAKDRAP